MTELVEEIKEEEDPESFKVYAVEHEISTESEVICPICLIAFEPQSKVKGLKCHKQHVYHKECLQLLKNKANKCALCK